MAVRDQVLQMLNRGETVSGEQMAGELGVSRNAVWKAIDRLRQDGYEIDAVTNRGYRMLAVPDRLSETEIARWLKTERIGREMEIHESLDSTNNRAKQLAAAGAPHGLLVAADAQSAGRGRMGRSFFSPRCGGVYLSFVLRPDCGPEAASLLTSMAAVAAARAIDSLTGADTKIKWVNDLYLGGKKVCGILCEAGIGMETGTVDYVVAGIGVNVSRMDFPPELREIATSIANERGSAPDRNRLTAEIADQLEALYPQLETGAFLEESRRRSNVIGREVLVLEGGRQYTAKAVDLDERGRLVIEKDQKKTHLASGEVSLKLL